MSTIPLVERPRHPGEILKTFLEARKVSSTQEEVAGMLGISRRRLNELFRGKRGVTSDTALRLAHYCGTTPEFWLHAQVAWDLHQARRSRDTMRRIARIPRLAGPPVVVPTMAAGGSGSQNDAQAAGSLPEPPELRRLRIAQLENRAREYDFLVEFLEREGLAARALRHARIRAQVDALGVEWGRSEG
jgi:antitoxin HigA-1